MSGSNHSWLTSSLIFADSSDPPPPRPPPHTFVWGPDAGFHARGAHHAVTGPRVRAAVPGVAEEARVQARRESAGNGEGLLLRPDPAAAIPLRVLCKTAACGQGREDGAGETGAGGSRQPLRGLSFSFLSTSLSFFVPGPPRTPFLSPSFLSRSLVLGPSRLRADTYSSVDSRPSPTPAREAAVHHQHRQRHL